MSGVTATTIIILFILISFDVMAISETHQERFSGKILLIITSFLIFIHLVTSIVLSIIAFSKALFISLVFLIGLLVIQLGYLAIIGAIPEMLCTVDGKVTEIRRLIRLAPLLFVTVPGVIACSVHSANALTSLSVKNLFESIPQKRLYLTFSTALQWMLVIMCISWICGRGEQRSWLSFAWPFYKPELSYLDERGELIEGQQHIKPPYMTTPIPH